MLWDLIRDFFVMHVFGGVASDEQSYSTFWGFAFGDYDGGYLGENIIALELKDVNGQIVSVNFADWLSTTATIISISIIVVLCCLFVYKIIKLIGGLIR